MTYTEPLILVFGLIALAGLVRRRRALATIGILGFLFVSWPPVDWLLARPLEARYSGRLLPASGAQAIVVLLSAVQMPRPNRPYPVPDQATFERCEYAACLYHHWRHLPVLVCGGPERAGGRPTSTAMREMLERDGIPETMIWTEERSRSTHENALYGAEVLRSHGISTIALVVEAQSMLRAEACFQKQGITVVPAASGYREWGRLSEELIPSWRRFNGTRLPCTKPWDWRGTGCAAGYGLRWRGPQNAGDARCPDGLGQRVSTKPGSAERVSNPLSLVGRTLGVPSDESYCRRPRKIGPRYSAPARVRGRERFRPPRTTASQRGDSWHASLSDEIVAKLQVRSRYAFAGLDCLLHVCQAHLQVLLGDLANQQSHRGERSSAGRAPTLASPLPTPPRRHT